LFCRGFGRRRNGEGGGRAKNSARWVHCLVYDFSAPVLSRDSKTYRYPRIRPNLTPYSRKRFGDQRTLRLKTGAK
jgi:hypothetical protein